MAAVDPRLMRASPAARRFAIATVPLGLVSAAAIIAQAIDKMKRYQLVSGGDAPAFGVGGMTDKRWREFYQTMQSEGLYPKGLDYTKAYDLTFMRRAFQNFK